MVRVRFTHEDLVRIRIVPTYGPLVEAMFGFRALRTGELGPVPELWRRRMLRGRPRWAAPLSEVLGPELALDIFTLVGRAATAAEGLESVAAMSRPRLATEIDAAVGWRTRRGLDASRWPSAWLKALADDPTPGRVLAPLLDACQGALVAPHWEHIQRQLAVEVAGRTRAIVTGGIEELFRTLHPTVRWCGPTLELSRPGPPGEVHLDGRGLELVPVVLLSGVEGPFWRVDDPDAPAVLFYPALRGPVDEVRLLIAAAEPVVAGGGGGDWPLAELIGRTRAAALTAVAGGCTTSALARRIGISTAGASQHTGVLRRSGLITSVRDGSSVVHDLTPLGRSLLAGTDPDS